MGRCKAPKLKRDWIGRWVRCNRDIRNNGGQIMKKGTIHQVRDCFGGLRFGPTAKIPLHYVDLLPKTYKPKGRI